MPRKVILLSKALILQKPFLISSLRASEIFFLSNDYVSYLHLKERISQPENLKCLGDKFHFLEREYRKTFLKIFEEIRKQNPAPHFWQTSIFSQSSSAFPLQRYLIYFLFCHSQIKKKEDESPLVFIGDYLPLLELIELNALKEGFHVEKRVSVGDKWAGALLLGKLVFRIFYFLGKSLYQLYALRKLSSPLRSLRESSKIVLFRSWYTQGSLKSDGKYRDRNFGPLLEEFRERGHDVWVLPLFFNLKGSYREEVEKMNKAKTSFLINESLLNFCDIFWVLKMGCKCLWLRAEKIQLKSIPLKKIILHCHWNLSLSPYDMNIHLHLRILDKLKKAKIEIECCFYAFENNSIEKAFTQTFKDNYPCSKIIGFQHTVLLGEQLNLYLGETTPLPDRIICSGRAYPLILEKLGYPKKIIDQGVNLRFPSIHESHHFESLRGQNLPRLKGKVVSLIFNYSFCECVETLYKISHLLQEISHLTLYLKPHPLLGREQLAPFLKIMNFPFIHWFEGSVQELASRSHVVIMPCSSVSALEVLCMGAPVLLISLENSFNFNPLWEEEAPLLCQPEEIRRELRSLLGENSGAYLKREVVEQIHERYFTPPHSDHRETFFK